MCVVRVTIHEHRVADHPKNLVTETLVVAALELHLDAVVAAVSAGGEQVDGSVGLLIVGTPGYGGEFAGRQGLFPGDIPEIVRSRVVVIHPLLLLVSIISDVGHAPQRVGHDFFPRPSV